MKLPDVGRETQTREPDDHEGGGTLCYLLVIEDRSSRRVSLPFDGVLHIGRDPEADIPIVSADVSRRHARLIMAGGRAQIADSGSHNGTLVNGDRVDGSQSLSSGDVVTIGDALLVLRVASPELTHRAISFERMRERIQEELARAVAYGRPFAIAVVRLDELSSRRGLEPAALAVLREMDALALDGTSIVALLPELDGAAARMMADALVAGVTPLSPGARAGLACYPHDGCDLDTLLSAARAAAAAARHHGVSLASELQVEISVGESTVIIADPAMTKLYDLIRRLAASSVSVLINGETGTGKENAAEALHHWSPRTGKPFAAQNCAALQDTLIESELFGVERGGYSDARTKPGLLERANGGTVFLDEVGDLSLAAQAKLLRALETKRVSRVGDTKERDIDVRVVSATKHNLDELVRAGRFRDDLLFRLSAAVVTLPPLRDRRREVPLLARFFVERERLKMNHRAPLELADAVMATLNRYPFPGNIRELKNAMEVAVATAEGGVIHLWNLSDKIRAWAANSSGLATPEPRATPRRFRAVADEIRALERQRILEALEACGGVKTRAAAAIGMPIRTFSFKLKQFGIDVEELK